MRAGLAIFMGREFAQVSHPEWSEERRAELTAAKRLMRKEVKQRVREMEARERTAESLAITERFLGLEEMGQAPTVLLYVGHLAEEWDTLPLARLCLSRGQRVVLPRVRESERRLGLVQVDRIGDLKPGSLGIPEPPADAREVAPGEIDWALIPGLAFDERGNRLGRGAGYYDRLLALLRPGVPRWAGAFKAQRVERVPTDDHDLPVHAVIGDGWGWFPGLPEPSRGTNKPAPDPGRSP